MEEGKITILIDSDQTTITRKEDKWFANCNIYRFV